MRQGASGIPEVRRPHLDGRCPGYQKFSGIFAGADSSQPDHRNSDRLGRFVNQAERDGLNGRSR